jgi:hypothetical protein
MALVCKAFGDIITFTRASTGTFFNSAGVLTSAAIDAPRFDYDPVTLAARGLLIEEQRTNLLPYSDDFSNLTGWATANASISANAATAPDATTSADKLLEDTVNTTHRVDRAASVTITTATAYTYSVYAKAAERNWVVLQFTNGFTTNAGAYFDLTNGVVGNLVNSPTSTSITPVGNGWYRCSITATSNTTAAAMSIYVASANGTVTYAGTTGNGLFIWGAQLEAGPSATSYIPTVASQVTRSADVASVNTLSPWYNATEGTLYASVSGFSVGLNSSALASITDNPTVSNWIQLSGVTASTSATVVSGGASQASFNSLSSVASGGSVAIAYKANDFAAVVNGGTVSTDVSGSVPSSVSVLRIGGFGSNPGPTNGHIRRITYYPRRLSNAELVSITS